MPKAIPDFERLVCDFYRSLCNLSTSQPQISNVVFGDLAREGTPITQSGVPGTSYSEWTYRFACLVWETVRRSSGIKRLQFRTDGLSPKERKAITDKEVTVVESVSQFKLPPDAELERFAGIIEHEFRRALALQRRQGLVQIGRDGITPALLETANDITDLLQSTVALLKAASPPKGRGVSKDDQASLTNLKPVNAVPVAADEANLAAREVICKKEENEKWEWVPFGDGYRISGMGESGHIANLKGLRVIELLLSSPGQPVPMPILTTENPNASRSDKRSKQPTLDIEALRDAFQKRLSLQDEIAHAETAGRIQSANESRTELENLNRFLRPALAIDGKPRDLNSLADSLRPRIIALLTRVYAKMRNANPPMTALANHLEQSISSQGLAFIYQPISSLAPSWNLSKSPEVTPSATL
jgi:hypothetical protein